VSMLSEIVPVRVNWPSSPVNASLVIATLGGVVSISRPLKNWYPVVRSHPC
jgi:hypothetical protein